MRILASKSFFIKFSGQKVGIREFEILLELLFKFLEGRLQSVDLGPKGGDLFFQLFDPLVVGSAA